MSIVAGRLPERVAITLATSPMRGSHRRVTWILSTHVNTQLLSCASRSPVVSSRVSSDANVEGLADGMATVYAGHFHT